MLVPQPRLMCSITVLLLVLVGSVPLNAQETLEQKFEDLVKDGEVVLEDDFNGESLSGWNVNDARAQRTSKIADADFVSQAQLVDQHLQVRRTEGSDHGAAVRKNAKFTDVGCQLKFRFDKDGSFSVNVNDPKCKTVHAGHIFKVDIRPKQVMIQDQKFGTMLLENRNLRKAGKDKEAIKKLNEALKSKSKKFKSKVATGEWHELEFVLKGDTVSVWIDDNPIGEFASAGFSHPTKENIALAVNKNVDIDDLKIWAIEK